VVVIRWWDMHVILQKGGPMNLVQGYGGEGSLSRECGGCDKAVCVLISVLQSCLICRDCRGFTLCRGSYRGEKLGIYIKV
jgi:hypothetical protein